MDASTPIVIVGHVDHGKSTLIGRLLHDTGNLPTGHVDAAIASSARRGLKIEWSFLLDSLQAERDQGVTIDSTRLPFALDGRPFVIVDAPGHRQFLRNMITGAADAAAAVLVVDVAEGVQDQTRRHAMLLRLIGVRHVIVLLNKADLLDHDPVRLAAVTASVEALLTQMEITPVAAIPASARHGDNVAERSAQMPWYTGPTLTEALAAVPPQPPRHDRPLRLPIQDVYRDGDRRVVVGRIEGGRLAVGDSVHVGAAALPARIAAIEAWSAPPQTEAVAGQSVALVLEPEVVVDRGDLLYAPGEPPLRAARLRARLFWLRQEPLRIGEAFHLRVATAEHAVTVAAIETVVQLDDLTEQAADHVPPEGFATIVLAAPASLLFDAFEATGHGGRGVLVDSQQRIVGVTPLLGPAPLPEAAPALFPVDSAVTQAERALAKGHTSGVFWMTGLPGAGKSTLARAVEARLFRSGMDVAVLDGDTLRSRLSPDLGFSAADRAENVRRTAAVARIMADAGLVVLVALISPREADRTLARQAIGAELFHEIYVAADLATCEARDPKGLYAAARAGKLPGFTGIDAPYDVPRSAALILDTAASAVAVSVDQLAAYIRSATALSAQTPG